MNIESIKKALDEALEFETRALKYLEYYQENKDNKYFYGNPKLSGSLKRQSMELTRALSEMRKPEQ